MTSAFKGRGSMILWIQFISFSTKKCDHEGGVKKYPKLLDFIYERHLTTIVTVFMFVVSKGINLLELI